MRIPYFHEVWSDTGAGQPGQADSCRAGYAGAQVMIYVPSLHLVIRCSNYNEIFICGTALMLIITVI
jgi:hypothetical protein